MADHAVLIDLWEKSVRATHGFLSEEDIIFYRELICNNRLFEQVSITVAEQASVTVAEQAPGIISGFLGISEGFVEMLFLDPQYRGRGIGGLLLRCAIHNGCTKVDVNEDNTSALEFYRHFGFRETGRSARDGAGKPFPIVHLQLADGPAHS